MPEGILKTKLELGFLGEVDVHVEYWHQRAESDTNTDDSVEVEAVTIFLDVEGEGLKPIEIDIAMIDDSDLRVLIDDCSEDIDRQYDDRGNEP